MSALWDDDPLVVAARLGIGGAEYDTLTGRLADAMATEGLPVIDIQREDDLETAEWMVGLLYAAGYVPRERNMNKEFAQDLAAGEVATSILARHFVMVLTQSVGDEPPEIVAKAAMAAALVIGAAYGPPPAAGKGAQT